jgi:hypothetical protein
MMYHGCEIFVPKLYGRRRTPVEPEVLAEIHQMFNVQFGGATPLGETGINLGDGLIDSGSWRNPKTGEIVEDACWLFRVYVLPSRLQEFEAVAHKIGEMLEQEEVLIDFGQPTGKFLKITDGTETEDEMPGPAPNAEEEEEEEDKKQQDGNSSAEAG